MTTPLRNHFRRARSAAAHALAWSMGRTADHVSRLGDRVFDAAGDGPSKQRPTRESPDERRIHGGACRAAARCCDRGSNALILLSELLLREPRSGSPRTPPPRPSNEPVERAASAGGSSAGSERRSAR